MRNFYNLPGIRTICEVCAVLLVFIICQKGYSQNRDLDVYPYWSYYSDVSNVLYETLCETAFDQIAERTEKIKGLTSQEDWIARQTEVKETLIDILGPFPDKTPLNPVVTGTMEKDGIIVEKLYFESRPGYYVTSIFTYPADAEGPLPAILFCSGHAETGFRSEAYQHMIFNYVKKGFAVLAFDPIGQGERIRYLDPDGKPRMGPTREHSYPGSQSFLAGISPATYFVWDGIRAVDYLLTREEVDPDRLGITGRSGGGTQTAYIAALDDRIVAAAPECYITTFDKLLKSRGPQDAEQNMMNGIARGIDMADYIEVRAPKPTLIVSTTRDIFSIQGVRDVFDEASRAYHALGAPDNLEKVEDDAGHSSTLKNREATYAFFQKHLNVPGNAEDEEVPVFEVEDLWVSASGNAFTQWGGEDIFSLTKADLSDRKNSDQPLPEEKLREKLVAHSGYRSLGREDVVFSGRTGYDGYSIEKYLLPGSGDYYLPVTWLKPGEDYSGTIILLDENGKNSAGEEGEWADHWLANGYSVVLADLSGMGEIGGGYSGGDARIDDVPLNIWYAGILTGRSLTGIYAEEINQIRTFVGQSGIQPVTIVARGGVGTGLLHAVFFESGDEKLVFSESLWSYDSILKNREYDVKHLMYSLPGGILYYDLDDLYPFLDDDRYLVINPVDGQSALIDEIPHARVFYADDEDASLDMIDQFLKK